jgi:excisionase family DNA binding protein
MVDGTTASGLPPTVRRRLKPHTPIASIAVAPLEVARLLSCGLGHVYGLMNNGELEAVSSGRARRVTTKSIQDYVQRQLAAKACDPASAPARRRGRQQRKRD